MGVDQILKGSDLFGALNVDEINRISSFSSVREFQSGELIYQHNQPCSHLFMLMEGSVYLQLPANPPDFSFIISKVEKGELFGLSSLLGASRYPSAAKCLSAVKVLFIEARPFRELLQSNSTAGFSIINRVAQIYLNRYIEILKSLQGVVRQISLTP